MSLVRLQCPACSTVVRISAETAAQHPVVRCAHCHGLVNTSNSRVTDQGPRPNRPRFFRRAKRPSTDLTPFLILGGVVLVLFVAVGLFSQLFQEKPSRLVNLRDRRSKVDWDVLNRPPQVGVSGTPVDPNAPQVDTGPAIADPAPLEVGPRPSWARPRQPGELPGAAPGTGQPNDPVGPGPNDYPASRLPKSAPPGRRPNEAPLNPEPGGLPTSPPGTGACQTVYELQLLKAIEVLETTALLLARANAPDDLRSAAVRIRTLVNELDDLQRQTGGVLVGAPPDVSARLFTKYGVQLANASMKLQAAVKLVKANPTLVRAYQEAFGDLTLSSLPGTGAAPQRRPTKR